MDALPEVIEVRGVALTRIESPAELTCWSGDIPGTADGRLHIVMQPAGPATLEALEAAGLVVDRFAEFVRRAITFLVTELQGGVWALDPAERERLNSAEPPFARPDAVVWGDGGWMLRFDECGLRMGEDYGIGVLFTGDSPSAVEDLSDVDDAAEVISAEEAAPDSR